jgi:hypothetical protein
MKGKKVPLTTTVPDNWTDEKISAVAYKLYDAVHCLGPVLRFDEWWGRFFLQTSEASARRTWERWKRDFRDAGCEFELREDTEEYGRVESIAFKSTAYALGMVEALIGPADPQLQGLPTRTIFDLFPGESHEDVEALMEALAQDLLKKRGQS